MSHEGWNPRYVAYAAAHGRTPEAMRDHDAQAWPGGPAVGFMLWISENLQAWGKARGRRGRRLDFLGSEADHEDFTAWLQGMARLPCPVCTDGSCMFCDDNGTIPVE